MVVVWCSCCRLVCYVTLSASVGMIFCCLSLNSLHRIHHKTCFVIIRLLFRSMGLESVMGLECVIIISAAVEALQQNLGRPLPLRKCITFPSFFKNS